PGARLAEEFGLGVLVDLANVLDAGSLEQRRDGVAEIDLIDLVDLGGDLERDAARPGDGDGAVRPFFRTDAPEEGEIAAARVEGRVEAPRGVRAGYELGRCERIAAGEQRHVVPLGDQLLGDPGDDPFGAAVKPWRHALDKRGDLGDPHARPRQSWSMPPRSNVP